jgi:hypothetical protein
MPRTRDDKFTREKYRPPWAYNFYSTYLLQGNLYAYIQYIILETHNNLMLFYHQTIIFPKHCFNMKY